MQPIGRALVDVGTDQGGAETGGQGIPDRRMAQLEVGSDNPTVLPLESVETGKNYAMVITTAGGLWRYQIGDTVRFTSLFPHKFVISGRTKHFINAFGEELMVDNADKAITRTCQEKRK